MVLCSIIGFHWNQAGCNINQSIGLPPISGSNLMVLLTLRPILIVVRREKCSQNDEAATCESQKSSIERVCPSLQIENSAQLNEDLDFFLDLCSIPENQIE